MYSQVTMVIQLYFSIFGMMNKVWWSYSIQFSECQLMQHMN